MIRVQPQDAQSDAAWRAVLKLAREDNRSWTLIGAQMVVLHGWEHGREPMRTSRDFDLLVNVRLVTKGTERCARRLQAAGFELAVPSPDGVAHRMRDSTGVVIDVLAPDGVGRRTPLTTIPPARTIQVPGGSQALKRTELVPVHLGRDTVELPRPNLLGAILIKARAIAVDDVPDDQRADLAFLLALVQDPRSLSRDMSNAERGWLRAHTELLDPAAPAWAGISNAEDGVIALDILSGKRGDSPR